MHKIILSPGEVEALVRENKYPVNPVTRFMSRCIDGRYANSEDLPALATAGADPGELGALLAAADKYGFEVDSKKAFEVLVGLVGGVKKMQGHTDTHSAGSGQAHGDATHILTGCGHIRHMTADPAAYDLTPEHAGEVLSLFAVAKEKGAQEVVLEGAHQEGAVLIVRGNYGIMPQYALETAGGVQQVQVFVYHVSLTDARRREWAKKLVQEEAVTLFEGLGDEYLYEVLAEEAENHLMETAGQLAKGLPIFEVTFKEDGEFDIEEAGKI